MWTQENTEGFTDADLVALNFALEALAAEFEDVDPANLNDMLNNAWTDGADANTLIAAVRANMR